MSRVSPVYHTASPVAATAEASRANKRIVFDRLSKTSWPLTASITQRLPLRMATLTRSHSISRRPSLAIVYAVSIGSSEAWTARVKSSSRDQRTCRSEKCRS